MESEASAIFSEQSPVPSIAIDFQAIALGCLAQLCLKSEETGAEPARAELAYLRKFDRRFSHSAGLAIEFQRYLKKPNKRDLFLLHLCNHYGLSPVELLSVVVCIAVEEDPMMGRCLTYLQHPTGGSRPTLGLIEKAFQCLFDSTAGLWLAASISSGKAIKNEVLTLAHRDEPLPDQALAMPLNLVKALAGIDVDMGGGGPAEAMHCLTESVKKMALSHAHSLLSETSSALVIRSSYREEKKQVAANVAQQMKKRPLFIANPKQLPNGLGAYCFITQSLPIFEFSLNPSERVTLPKISGYSGAIIILLGVDGSIDCDTNNPSGSGLSVLEWLIQTPSRADRKKIWLNFIKDEKLAAQLGHQYIHCAGRISQLSKVAHREASRNGQTLNIDDVKKATWSSDDNQLGALAQAMEHKVEDNGLVLDGNVERQMRSLYLRCLNRESLDCDLGISIKQRYHHGVKALMVGPSGTGKTLSANWLATKLGLPLYRVDIASIVSKYIGETEKNLANLMEKSEGSDVVLLFDEADALFGKRTDVKDSSDRFANSQTNYLLQRIENYQGIVLLTSNSRSRIDQAFMRRIDHIIEFSQPGPEERRKLWRVHLGVNHGLDSGEINKIAVKCEFGGGHIRNAVLTAAVHAKSESRAIQYDDLLEGVACEYRKMGKQTPIGLKV